MAIKLSAYLTGFSSRTDGSASLRFSSGELSAEDFGLLQQHLNSHGWLLFAESNLSAKDIPKEELVEDDEKKPSRRLRASLFVFWTQQGKQGNFEDFYRKNMETFIDVVKAKLE